MTKVISFFNSKGGIGKSTLTNAIANQMIYNAIERLGRKLRVAVIEIDTQKTLTKRRDNDIDYLKADINAENFRDLPEDLQRDIRKMQKSYFVLQQQNGYTSYNLFFLDSTIDSHIRQAIDITTSGEYDIILIDFPGTTEQDGLPEFLSMLDYLFIPANYGRCEIDGLESFLEFKECFPEKTYFVLNEIEMMKKSKIEELREYLMRVEPKYPILKTGVLKTTLINCDSIVPASININLNTLAITKTSMLQCIDDLTNEILNIIDIK